MINLLLNGLDVQHVYCWVRYMMLGKFCLENPILSIIILTVAIISYIHIGKLRLLINNVDFS